MKEFEAELTELGKSGLIRKLTCIETSRGSKFSINGKTYINFSSNDYLGLSKNPEIVKSASLALKKYGFG